jgi:uncharacterized membrane protein YedE/YeeE
MGSSFTPGSALAGGILIGLSASGMLLLAGRIAGVSGIVGGVLFPVRGDTLWRGAFLGGLFVGGILLRFTAPQLFFNTADNSALGLIVAGLLVGVGTRLSGGCTSGHGVCGIARLSRRSLVATGVFMAAGFLATYLLRHVWGAL